jgi:type I restriction enzyme S subunit
MALNKLGDLIELVNIKSEISNLTIFDVSGINKDKEFFLPTIQVGEDTSNYKIVPPHHFACNLMHVGRDIAIPIALNKSTKNTIVSPAYSVFYVKQKGQLLDEYLYMNFKKIDFDRYAAFCTDSSVRDGLELIRFLEMEVELPPIEVQQKVVDVYLAMVANQKAYEKGIDDLKITYEAYIEDLRRSSKKQPINSYLYESLERNIGSKIPTLGVSIEKRFIEAKRESTSYENYKIVKHNEFAIRPVLDKMDSSFTLALNSSDNCAVSPAYIVFGTKNDILLPKYLMLWLSRKETERWLAFNAWGSARNTIELSDLGNLEIPIPSINIQQDIVEVFEAYEIRKKINEKLKKKINEICPILIKGSVL